MVPIRGVLGRFWSCHDGSVYMFVNYTVLCSFTKRRDNRSGGLDLECPNSRNRLQCLLPAIRPSNSTLSRSHDISHGENGHIHLLRAVMENPS
jgi:hypothetical protein